MIVCYSTGEQLKKKSGELAHRLRRCTDDRERFANSLYKKLSQSIGLCDSSTRLVFVFGVERAALRRFFGLKKEQENVTFLLLSDITRLVRVGAVYKREEVRKDEEAR